MNFRRLLPEIRWQPCLSPVYGHRYRCRISTFFTTVDDGLSEPFTT